MNQNTTYIFSTLSSTYLLYDPQVSIELHKFLLTIYYYITLIDQ